MQTINITSTIPPCVQLRVRIPEDELEKMNSVGLTIIITGWTSHPAFGPIIVRQPFIPLEGTLTFPRMGFSCQCQSFLSPCDLTHPPTHACIQHLVFTASTNNLEHKDGEYRDEKENPDCILTTCDRHLVIAGNRIQHQGSSNIIQGRTALLVVSFIRWRRRNCTNPSKVTHLCHPLFSPRTLDPVMPEDLIPHFARYSIKLALR